MSIACGCNYKRKIYLEFIDFRQSLPLGEGVEILPQVHQLLERTLLNDLAVFEDDNSVGIFDCAQSVSDRQRSLILQDFFQVLEDNFLCISIESRSELIE